MTIIKPERKRSGHGFGVRLSQTHPGKMTRTLTDKLLKKEFAFPDFVLGVKDLVLFDLKILREDSLLRMVAKQLEFPIHIRVFYISPVLVLYCISLVYIFIIL